MLMLVGVAVIKKKVLIHCEMSINKDKRLDSGNEMLNETIFRVYHQLLDNAM